MCISEYNIWQKKFPGNITIFFMGTGEHFKILKGTREHRPPQTTLQLDNKAFKPVKKSMN